MVELVMKFYYEKDDQNKKNKKKQTQTQQESQPNTIYTNLYYPSNKVHCDNCKKDISKQVKIYCTLSNADICVNCFADGIEFDNHKIEEDYNVINKLNYPLISENWTCEEELLLFEGLQRYGFGNWNDVQDHIGTDKTKEEIEKHYEDYHLDKINKQFYPQEFLSFIAERQENTLELKILNNLNNEIFEDKFLKKKFGNVSETIGYMPLRGDFEVEYDNDAELLLAEMEFNDDDKPNELAMKYKLLEIYNARLDERVKRKNLLQKEVYQILERSKEEKEIYNMMKVFARFSTPEEHERLVQGIIKERQIRQKIEELKTYKKIGLNTFEDIEIYLNEKRKNDETYNKKMKQNEKIINEKAIINNNNQYKFFFFINIFIYMYVFLYFFKEINLCEQLDISPYEYLVMKEVLVREAVKENFIKKDFAENKLKLGLFQLQYKQLYNIYFLKDKDRATGIFDFLVANKYILEKKQ
ncbi:hypothetical protein IMG5_119510 [Ichthyophthirius multifiliis]|uniref:Transcriptional adapter n=1 Tax=Ichthyophthirius multifiliis TaxID=5932 RepID=G0QUU9_ICHMU|nr:hypothetical protein IMG5_119510 [Ichthyophthirius multifiliis]EGR31009.1 hypothetical protein IMG5_119510 [Ichthyophthirius multifiliis]|eukprot:XP_004034495.1 hypothetical protein IMG5_119510 [Ichthyophthirius multifiliis]